VTKLAEARKEQSVEYFSRTAVKRSAKVLSWLNHAKTIDDSLQNNYNAQSRKRSKNSKRSKGNEVDCAR
jgi:hypothetical protein